MNNNLRDLFQQPFDLVTYRSVILSQLLHAQRLLTSPEMLEQYDNGDQLYGLGYLTDNEGKEIGLYYTHVPNGDVRRKRVGFRKMLHPYVKYGVDAAIAVFDDGEYWRLSYICDLKGGVTSAKRFSYVFGDPKGQYNTPVGRLTDLSKKRLILDELHKTFSVDALSKEFFDEYHRHYDRIIAELSRQGNTGAVFHDYVKKMMGRIVFLHFLQKKRWLNDDPEFLSKLFFLSPYKQDFLEQELEPLFFGIFNTEPDKREQLFQQEHWDLRWLEEWEKLPYLNGGLFERDDVDKMKIKLPASLFEKLFEFMASYNFTIDENDPDDADIGIDPEMLGKIFESLLEDNKAKGAFYTPKEIVRYMCKESLIAYLNSKVNSDEVNSESKENQITNHDSLVTAVRQFVEQHEFPEELDPYREVLDTALRNVKICDPAIGSGAFPMGLLNELWRCREALEERSISQTQVGTQATGLSQAGSLCSKEGQAGSLYPYSRAALKREIIENNIYGVDIEKGAIDIARLRFWLSIVVDAEKPEPLPNFDYKFMQGNSLIESYKGFDLLRISNRLPGGQSKSTQLLLGLDSDHSRKNLQRLMRDYFSVTDHKQKDGMRQAINEAVKQLITDFIGGTNDELKSLNPSANKDFFLWHTWFKDIFDNGGFDIVIGNPPYGAKYPDEWKLYYKRTFVTAKTITGKQKGSLDTFTLFIEHGYNILKKDGNLAFIVPIAITSSDSVTGVHRLMLSNCDNIYVSSYAVRPKPVFERAVVNTSILLFKKTGSPCSHLYSTKMHRRGDKFNLQYLVDNLQYTDVKNYLLYGRIPKIGTEIEKSILGKVYSQNKIKSFIKTTGSPIVYRFAGGRYFKVVTNYSNGSSAERTIHFSDSNLANSVGCILSSNLSFWFYQIYSDNLNWKSYEIENFSIPQLSTTQMNDLCGIYKRYLNDIEDNANIRETTGESSYNVDSFKEYKIVRSKNIIDEIDDYIGPLYGLTPEEIDFIKNYELEFRMAGE